MITCIYKISSIIKPERFYIGSAKDFTKRKREHKNALRKGNHCNPKLQNHVNKYGLNDLKFDMVGLINDLTQLIIREQYYIDLFNPYFNICKIAGSKLGVKLTKETKEKIRLGNLGKKVSDESRKKMSLAKTGISINKGRKASKEAKQKMREIKLGKKANEETKLKMSESAKLAWQKRREKCL